MKIVGIPVVFIGNSCELPFIDGWYQVINEFSCILQSMLYNIGEFIVRNASEIASIFVGVNILYFAIRYAERLQVVRNLLSILL